MLTVEVLMRVEDDMRAIVENEYASLSANLWWSDLTKVMPSKSRREVIHWLISTATLKDQGYGGNVKYDDVMMTYTELTNKQSGTGLELDKNEFDDLDGSGVDSAAKWSSDIGQAFAYWPQEQASYVMNNGETASYVTGYDKKAFFATDHPCNPVDNSSGLTFANLFTSTSSGTYPGALPIDESVTVETAVGNLKKLFAYMASIPQPNGKYPRRLRPVKMYVPPALKPRATLLADAKFIAMTAGSGAAQGGTTDIEGYIRSMGFGIPVECDELATQFGGNDTSYFVQFAPLGVRNTNLGSMIYVQREPFGIVFHGPMTTAELARKNKLQWLAKGRNVMGPGHPYTLVKVKAA